MRFVYFSAESGVFSLSGFVCLYYTAVRAVGRWIGGWVGGWVAIEWYLYVDDESAVLCFWELVCSGKVVTVEGQAQESSIYAPNQIHKYLTTNSL